LIVLFAKEPGMIFQEAQMAVSQSEQLPLPNAEVAARLDQGAELLEAQGENPFRVEAYRKAARTVRTLPAPLADWLVRPSEGHPRLILPGLPKNSTLRKVYPQDASDENSPEKDIEQLGKSLQDLPGIGVSLAQTIAELTLTGRWELLAELSQQTSPHEVLGTVPGIGAELAERIHQQLGIETLPELAAAAHDGRLSHVAGFGPKRLRGVRETLAGRLRLSASEMRAAAGPIAQRPLLDEPSVEELLNIDVQYRRQAALGILPKIAPRKFNPTRAAWLPVLHTQRSGRQYSVMYSNTARAHDLGTTRDWVVIHRHDSHGQGQWTVVTAQYGPHKGKRVVRGREEEE
jgi:hypothetical protein